MTVNTPYTPPPDVLTALPTFDVLDTRINAVDLDAASNYICRSIDLGRKTYVVFGTVSSVLWARDNAQVHRAIDGAGMVTPDGMPLVWLGKRVAGSDVERVYGPDLVVHLMATTGPRLRHFFYGGSPGVAQEMANRLSERFPGLRVAGVMSPERGLSGSKFQRDDVDVINSARPDIVWVGLGHPKQELWMHTHRDAIEAPVLAGVGAAFDFLSGQRREAPIWMKRSGLQWLHRFLHEPTRLWRRYLIGNPRFIFLLARRYLVPGASR